MNTFFTKPWNNSLQNSFNPPEMLTFFIGLIITKLLASLAPYNVDYRKVQLPQKIRRTHEHNKRITTAHRPSVVVRIVPVFTVTLLSTKLRGNSKGSSTPSLATKSQEDPSTPARYNGIEASCDFVASYKIATLV